MVTATPPAQETGRRKTRGKSTRRRAGRLYGAVIGLALAAAAVGAQHYVPTLAERGEPLSYSGALKENVDATRFSARVDSVTAARSIQIKGARQDGEKITSDHLFLIVSASATVPRDPIHVQGTLLTGRDQKFAATDKVDSSYTLSYPWVQPGWWAKGVYVFEVPADVLAGSRLIVTFPPLSEPFPPQAEIDLGLDDAAAKNLVATAKDTYELARN
ncbi:hypothetical protein [Streptosporangium sp. KLBMP 9127]|nr:hypothetical protein [Streptosporangium sp. KLBMP 9127]